MWETKLITMVCLSTAESEYIAAVNAAKTALWLARMCSGFCDTAFPTINMLEDNQVCIQMIKNPVVSVRNRHFTMRMWWLREQVENNLLLVTYISSNEQLANILTKVLPAPLFLTLRGKILGVNVSSPIKSA